MTDKTTLRNHLQTLRKGQFSKFVVDSSLQIAARLFQLDAYKKSKKIGLYDALDHEVQTKDIFEHAFKKGKTCLYPKVVGQHLLFGKIKHESELKKGRFGVREPKYPSIDVTMDSILVPCVGVDVWGRRLGQGGGYYDRYLENFKGTKIALAFDFQLHPSIPSQAHDMKVHWIITESKTIRCY